MKLFRYYKSILIIILILILSLLPADSTQKISIDIPHFDKLIHFIMYFFLAAVLLIDIKNNIKKPTRVLIASVLLSIFVFSGIVEVIQEFFILGRFGSLFDLTANFIGLITATILFFKTSIFSKFVQYS